MKSKKLFIVIILLILSIVASYSIPKAKYVGTGFISGLDIPDSLPGWEGRDVTSELGLNADSSMYDFVSEALAYQYRNREGKDLLFIILDAGNFHHPKVCFTGAGYKIKELADTEFQFSNHFLKAHTLFTKKGRDTSISFYWIVMDKNVAHQWVEQKFKQLFFSLFGQKRVGLMVRVDIPAKDVDIEEATILARQFITDISTVLEEEQAEYIFGIH